MTRINEFGQPIGSDLGGWVPPAAPAAAPLVGERVRLEPLVSSAHAEPLFAAFADAPDSLWTYMAFGPFAHPSDLAVVIDAIAAYPDWQAFAVFVDEHPVGFVSFLRIDAAAGVIEIGAISFSFALQRTTEATEALYLLVRHAFELGYRRVEWKCDDLNAPSRRAAVRLGFRYEGTFRQATHYKGRNRDTAWYAITDGEWPPLDRALRSWLAPANFDAAGIQIRPLGEIRVAYGEVSE